MSLIFGKSGNRSVCITKSSSFDISYIFLLRPVVATPRSNNDRFFVLNRSIKKKEDKKASQKYNL
jgi:hypothetical protein